jgi:hypothetical protein
MIMKYLYICVYYALLKPFLKINILTLNMFFKEIKVFNKIVLMKIYHLLSNKHHSTIYHLLYYNKHNKYIFQNEVHYLEKEDLN